MPYDSPSDAELLVFDKQTDLSGLEVRLIAALREARAERDRHRARFEQLSLKQRDEAGEWVALGAMQEREECLAIVDSQPYYPDTNIGKRQQWVKDQIAHAIRARDSKSPGGTQPPPATP